MPQYDRFHVALAHLGLRAYANLFDTYFIKWHSEKWL